MTLGKRIAACALALALGLGALEVGDQLGVVFGTDEIDPLVQNFFAQFLSQQWE